LWPPSWIMPASKDTRVRVEAFSKIIPSTRFFSGSERMPRSRRSFSSMARRRRSLSSAGVQSISERKCRTLIVVTLKNCRALWRKRANVRKGTCGKIAGATKKGRSGCYRETSRARKCPRAAPKQHSQVRPGGENMPERGGGVSCTMTRKLPARGSADPRVAEVPLMDIVETIKEQIANNTILLYMKGSPNAPQCGFSSRAAQAVMGCGEKFAYVDILQNPEIRAELPKYANWPTFPQLWVNGE